jgi:hypothetical protein
MFTQPSSPVAVAGSSLAATLMLEPRDGDGGTPLHPWEHHLEWVLLCTCHNFRKLFGACGVGGLKGLAPA